MFNPPVGGRQCCTVPLGSRERLLFLLTRYGPAPNGSEGPAADGHRKSLHARIAALPPFSSSRNVSCRTFVRTAPHPACSMCLGVWPLVMAGRSGLTRGGYCPCLDKSFARQAYSPRMPLRGIFLEEPFYSFFLARHVRWTIRTGETCLFLLRDNAAHTTERPSYRSLFCNSDNRQRRCAPDERVGLAKIQS